MESNVICIDIEKRMLSSEGATTLKINTTIKFGEMVAIFGPSGAGKTTLLRILSGLIKPDKGLIRFGDSVWFDSENKINIPPQQRNISLMFQDYALFGNMTVEQNLKYAQPVKNREEITNLLEIFGLTEFQKKKPEGLSGGQKQRIALARALARKPKLLLLDEPLSAVDSQMRTILQDEIIRAHQYLGATSIMVSHDLGEVFRLATYVINIDKGEIIKTGLPDEVFSDKSVSGKVQILGKIVRIEKQDTLNIVTVVSGNNQILKVIAFDNDLEKLKIGSNVMVYTKAFNPIISPVG
jgi:molybdate transport system ATP-binding protein